MTKFRDFGAGNSEQIESPSFKIHDEEFKCVPQIQGKVMLELAANTSGDDIDAVKSNDTINKFFSTVLEDESLARFNALLEDKHKIVTVETLGEIVGWLMEQYTARPEEQPEVSSAGQ